MQLTPMETLITTIMLSLGIMITRFAPFILFPEGKKHPAVITYLGKVLPPAMMGLLIVYCLKGVSVTTFPYGIPELIAIICVVVLHLWRHNPLLSIGVGTAVYMLLIQVVFV